MPIRVALVAASLSLSVVLGLQLYAHDRLEAGQRATFLAGERALPPARRASVLADLRAAERLRPGTQAILPAALVQLRAGEAGDAERLARRAVEREPRNAVAWRILATILAGRDRTAATHARARAAALDPLTAGPRG